MNRIRIYLSIVIVAFVATLVSRHRKVQRLEVEQAILRQEIERVTQLPAAPNAEPELDVRSSENSPLPEHLELLRLRGEVGQLHRELITETNEMAKVLSKRAAVEPANFNEPVVSQQMALERLGNAKALAGAYVEATNRADGRVPRMLVPAIRNGATVLAGNQFEVMFQGSLEPDEKWLSETILFREAHPWVGWNKKWNRIYAFADGHTEVWSSETSDFTQREADHVRVREN